MSRAKTVFRRQIRRTLLVTVEGEAEEAFVKHLRALYCSGGAGVTVTIANAHGKGPLNVIETCVRNRSAFDRRAALFDADIPLDAAGRELAQSKAVEVILSRPAIEGMLLRILGQPVPDNTAACKRIIEQRFPGGLLEAPRYGRDFTRQAIDAARAIDPELDKLLRLIEGR